MTRPILSTAILFFLSFAVLLSTYAQTPDTIRTPTTLAANTQTNISIHLANDSLEIALIKALDNYNKASYKPAKPNVSLSFFSWCKPVFDWLSGLFSIIGISGGILGIIGLIKKGNKKQGDTTPPVTAIREKNLFEKAVEYCSQNFSKVLLITLPFAGYFIISQLISLITPFLIPLAICLLALVAFFYVLLRYLQHFDAKSELSRIIFEYRAPFNVMNEEMDLRRLKIERELSLIRTTSQVYVTYFLSYESTDTSYDIEALITVLSNDEAEETGVAKAIRRKFPDMNIETSRGYLL